MRIEIAGALSCGKSTLAALLRSRGHVIVEEDLSTNPYLELRVQDPETYDFPCQRQFVLDKLESLRQGVARGELFFSDFSLAAERAYLVNYLDGNPGQLRELLRLCDSAKDEIPAPAAIVHLKCAPEEQIERIRKRGREFEQGHDLGFLRRINLLVDDMVGRAAEEGIPVIEYRTDLIDWRSILADIEGVALPKLGWPLPAWRAAG